MCPKTHYWLNLGNNAERGQFVLGQPENAKTKMPTLRLPTVAELYPEIVNPKLDRKDKLPACSAAESLDRQEPFVNQTLAYQALAMLARLFRYGTTLLSRRFYQSRYGTSGAPSGERCNSEVSVLIRIVGTAAMPLIRQRASESPRIWVFGAKECDLYHTLDVPRAARLRSLMPPLRSIKIIVQRLPKGDSSAPSFKLMAYDVDTAKVYEPMQFRSAEELLKGMSPVTGQLVEALTSVPDRPGATIVFDQLLQISEAQLSVLGLKGRHSEGF